MENRRVRIRDIAEELGLSTATVSNVLHGKTAKISEETVRRVQALLEERAYIPSMAGILLAQNASRIVGVVINDHEKYESHALEDPFISSAVNALSAELSQNDLFLMVKTATSPEEIIRFGSMWNLDGLVLIGFCAHDYEHPKRIDTAPCLCSTHKCGVYFLYQVTRLIFANPHDRQYNRDRKQGTHPLRRLTEWVSEQAPLSKGAVMAFAMTEGF